MLFRSWTVAIGTGRGAAPNPAVAEAEAVTVMSITPPMTIVTRGLPRRTGGVGRDCWRIRARSSRSVSMPCCLNIARRSSFAVTLVRPGSPPLLRLYFVMADSHVVDVPADTFIGCSLDPGGRPPDDEFELLHAAAKWVPRSPLEEGVRETGPPVGLMWVARMAEVANHLHRFRDPGAPDGFVHRAIKPSNVRITPESRAVLIDFGVARPHTPDDMTDGVGTYLWKVPEVVGGPGSPGKASDVWGIGALAYWTIVGDRPRLESAEIASGRMQEAAAAWGLPDPARLAAHVAQLLEMHRDRRPTDLVLWARELRTITAD